MIGEMHSYTIESLPIVNKELKWIWGKRKNMLGEGGGGEVTSQKHQKPIYFPLSKTSARPGVVST